MIFGALIEAIDLAQLARLDADSAREEIRDIVNEIIAIKSIVMSIAEQEDLLDDICNDVLGFGPLEPLLARDDIADIMVNGSGDRHHDALDRDDLVDDVADFLPRRVGVETRELREVDGLDQRAEEIPLFSWWVPERRGVGRSRQVVGSRRRIRLAAGADTIGAPNPSDGNGVLPVHGRVG